MALYLTVGQRALLVRNTGSAIELGFLVAALLAWMGWRRPSGDRRLPHPWIPTVGPLFALLVVLPFLGVLFHGDSISSLYGWVVVLTPLALLAMARSHPEATRKAVYAAIVVQGLYGFGQMLYRLVLLPDALWGWAYRWDIHSQTVRSETYLIFGRSTGLFINANEFGLWSVLAVVFSAAFLRRSHRAAGVLLGVLGVIGSQSRTALVAMLLLSLWYLGAAVRNRHLAAKAVGWALVVTPALVLVWLMGALGRLVESEFVQRVVSGSDVVTHGVQADQSLAVRVSVWRAADAVVSQSFPFGTFGSPEAAVGTFIDNQFVSLWLQGSLLLVAAFLLALMGPLVLRRRGVPCMGYVGVMSAIIAVTSMTMLPLASHGASSLIWVAVGLAVAHWSEVRRDDHDAGSTVAARPGTVSVQ